MMRVLAITSWFLSAANAVTAPQTPDYNNLTVAIVRAEPANFPMPVMTKNWTGIRFDLNATVTKGVNLIKEAASNGANLVVFPELWFPGYLTSLSYRCNT
jgi:hypothetical protein